MNYKLSAKVLNHTTISLGRPILKGDHATPHERIHAHTVLQTFGKKECIVKRFITNPIVAVRPIAFSSKRTHKVCGSREQAKMLFFV